jgi:hypothetical protein
MITSIPGSATQARNCAAQLRRDPVALVYDNGPRRQLVPGLGQPPHQDVTGAVLGKCAAVGDGQDGDVDGNEFAAVVDAAH